jgi:hypothetical protein
MQKLMFLQTPDGHEFAVINVEQICFSQGRDETYEHPKGSKTEVHYPGDSRIHDIPWEVFKAGLRDLIKQNLEFSHTYNQYLEKTRAENLEQVMQRLMGKL